MKYVNLSVIYMGYVFYAFAGSTSLEDDLTVLIDYTKYREYQSNRLGRQFFNETNGNFPPPPLPPPHGHPFPPQPHQEHPHGPPYEGPPHHGPPHQGPPHQGPPYQGPPHQGPPHQGPPHQGSPHQGPPQQGSPHQGPPHQGPPHQGPPHQGPPHQGPPHQGPSHQGPPPQHKESQHHEPPPSVCHDPQNEVYQQCGSKCVLGCRYAVASSGVTVAKHDCDKNDCVEGCFCKTGLVRHQTKCIPALECPIRKCHHRDEVYMCGPAAPITCDNATRGKEIAQLTRHVECVWGCFCAQGYLRNNYNGKCVPESECRGNKIVDISPQIPGLFKHFGHGSAGPIIYHGGSNNPGHGYGNNYGGSYGNNYGGDYGNNGYGNTGYSNNGYGNDKPSGGVYVSNYNNLNAAPAYPTYPGYPGYPGIAQHYHYHNISNANPNSNGNANANGTGNCNGTNNCNGVNSGVGNFNNGTITSTMTMTNPARIQGGFEMNFVPENVQQTENAKPTSTIIDVVANKSSAISSPPVNNPQFTPVQSFQNFPAFIPIFSPQFAQIQNAYVPQQQQPQQSSTTNTQSGTQTNNPVGIAEENKVNQASNAQSIVQQQNITTSSLSLTPNNAAAKLIGNSFEQVQPSVLPNTNGLQSAGPGFISNLILTPALKGAPPSNQNTESLPKTTKSTETAALQTQSKDSTEIKSKSGIQLHYQ